MQTISTRRELETQSERERERERERESISAFVGNWVLGFFFCFCPCFFVFFLSRQKLSAMAMVLESATVLRDPTIPGSVLRARLSLPRSTGGFRVAFPTVSRRSSEQSSFLHAQSSPRGIVCEQQQPEQGTLSPGTSLFSFEFLVLVGCVFCLISSSHFVV